MREVEFQGFDTAEHNAVAGFLHEPPTPDPAQ
jgi:hypothetical protein